MRIDYLAPRPAATAFLAGPAKPAGIELTRGTVLVRSAFDLVHTGASARAMVPAAQDDARHQIAFADTGAVVEAFDDEDEDEFDLRAEADIALEKPRADIVVQGYVGGPGHSAQIAVNGSVWHSRSANPAPGYDVNRNLFGWQRRDQSPRQISADISAGNALPDAYTARFNNVYRRSFGFVRSAAAGAGLPDGAEVEITRLDDGDTDIYRLALPNPLSLQARYFTYCGHGADALPHWNPGPTLNLRPDTLIITPASHQAVILWRGGWDFSAHAAENYRTIQIVEGGF